MSGCSEDGCSRKHYARRLCNPHYQQRAYWGTLPERTTPQERFTEKTKWDGDCLVWTGHLDEKGYARFKYNGKVRVATNVVWEWENGPIPAEFTIDHTCHNPACVFIEHLRLATKKQQAENKAGASSNSKSGIRGVHLSKYGRWIAQVTHNNVNNYVGSFPTAEEAEAAVVAKRLELFTHNDIDRRAA